jgi:hypothetical protein
MRGGEFQAVVSPAICLSRPGPLSIPYVLRFSPGQYMYEYMFCTEIMNIRRQRKSPEGEQTWSFSGDGKNGVVRAV